ncbi:hypothetical protein EV175_001499, partial [Coemansia sp. RSA 1933]
MLVECLVWGILGPGGQVDEMAVKLREVYSIKTKWINHLNVWCNVLHALTIARGRHILGVEERVLIQESMFSGQRQRKGLSKVDAYLNSIKSPTYHLDVDDIHDILGTATPFNTTSNLVWDTMRLIFENASTSAQKECETIEQIEGLLKEDDGKLWRSDNGALDISPQNPCGAFTKIMVSDPKNLVQVDYNVDKGILIQTQSRKIAPPRVYRVHSSANRDSDRSVKTRSQDSLETQRKSQGDSTTAAETESKSKSAHAHRAADLLNELSIWKKVKHPFRKGKSSAVPTHSGDREIEPTIISRENLPATHDRNSEAKSHEETTTDSRDMSGNDKPGNIEHKDTSLLPPPPESSDTHHMPVASWEGMLKAPARSDSTLSISVETDSQEHHPVGPAFVSAEFQSDIRQSRHGHKKTGLRSASSIDAQKAEIALSSAKETYSRIILRGMVMSWNVYRAVLDCSRYAPDNDDVMLNTSWWIAEMATSYSTDDYRGRLAQLAMFRIGCHGSDHISSRVLFLRSRFVQTALITLSSLAGAATLLSSMVTMLSANRTISLNHSLETARDFSESNLVDEFEFQQTLGAAVDGAKKCEYPMIYDPLVIGQNDMMDYLGI